MDSNKRPPYPARSHSTDMKKFLNKLRANCAIRATSAPLHMQFHFTVADATGIFKPYVNMSFRKRNLPLLTGTGPTAAEVKCMIVSFIGSSARRMHPRKIRDFLIAVHIY